MLPWGFLVSLAVSGPFHTIGMNYMGLCVRSWKSKYLLLAVNYLTNCIETKAIKADTAGDTTHAFAKQIIFRHGAPVVPLKYRSYGLLMQHSVRKFRNTHPATTNNQLQCNGFTKKWIVRYPLLCSVTYPRTAWTGATFFVPPNGQRLSIYRWS